MRLDKDRIREILKAEHSYYGGGREIPHRDDDRWKITWDHLIAPHLTPDMHILDVGCGKGHFLLELSSYFKSGLGIDIDPDFLQMAEDEKRKAGISNVDFLLLDYPRENYRLEAGSFDMLVSNRGPIGDSPAQVRAAYTLLKPGGLLICQEIAELHHKEAMEAFEPASFKKARIRRADELIVMLESNGFDVRLSADFYTKTFYRDIYTWLEAECNLRAWLGIPLPEEDDPRLALFAEHTTTSAGEIETTNHVCWVAGVKQ
jgi:SAM-dependent methyltransferase